MGFLVYAPELPVEADLNQHLFCGVSLQEFESLLQELLLSLHVFEAVHGGEGLFQLAEDEVFERDAGEGQNFPGVVQLLQQLGQLLVDVVDDGPASKHDYMMFLTGMGSKDALSLTFLKF